MLIILFTNTRGPSVRAVTCHAYSCRGPNNEVRINVYVWADFSATTSRVDGGGGADVGRGEGALLALQVVGALRTPRAGTRLAAPRTRLIAQPLYILTGYQR